MLHFKANELPPVQAFWSVTMYDSQGFQVPNPLSRLSLGDRDPLEDGSLGIYIQTEPPQQAKIANWLPATAVGGKMGITMRLYYPNNGVLTGQWRPPAIVKQAL